MSLANKHQINSICLVIFTSI